MKLRDLCFKSEQEKDDFVGLRFENNMPKVIFPRGFRIPETDDKVRREILKLFSAIYYFGDRSEGVRDNQYQSSGQSYLNFPINSYQYIIKDFLCNGYYSENEVHYIESRNGKINWKRTIQKERPHLNNGNIVYLQFISKVNQSNSNTLLTKIHEYCVYESFQKLGWLYLQDLPKEPSIEFNSTLFLNTLKTELKHTFNEQKKKLLQSMLNIIQYQDTQHAPQLHNAYGVERFEHVWENLIDYEFGENNKDAFFPKSTWHIISPSADDYTSSPLEPDTIMIYDGNVYILDAKYYKFGVTGQAKHLPATSSIQKQITYSTYIKQMDIVDQNKIYNAFIMPFEKGSMQDENYKFVSVATADWEKYDANTLNCKYILGILMDTRYLIDNFSKHNRSEIEAMATLIETSLMEFRRKAEKS